MRWFAAVIAFMVPVAFWQGIPAFSVAPKWAVLCLVPLLLFGRRVEMKAAHWLGLLYLAWATVSLHWTLVLLDGYDGWIKLLLPAACFMLGSVLEDATPVFWGFALGVAVQAPLALAQQYWHWGGVDQLVYPAGLFGNKNFFGEAAALALIGIAFTKDRTWWLAAAALLACLWVAESRAAWLALAIVGFIAYGRWTRRWRLLTELAIVVVGGGLLFLELLFPAQTAEFFQCAAMDLGERFYIWGDTFAGLTWLGRGVGSYMAAYPEHQQFLVITRRPEFAHNDFLQCIFELGLPGAILAGCLLVCCLAVGDARARLVFAAFLVEGFFGFPLHMPGTAFLGAFVAGCAARSGPDLRFVLARLRTVFGDGMVVARRALHPVSRA